MSGHPNPIDCPRVEYGETVFLVWRDAEGRRCSTWRTAQDIGELIAEESKRRAALARLSGAPQP